MIPGLLTECWRFQGGFYLTWSTPHITLSGDVRYPRDATAWECDEPTLSPVRQEVGTSIKDRVAKIFKVQRCFSKADKARLRPPVRQDNPRPHKAHRGLVFHGHHGGCMRG